MNVKINIRPAEEKDFILIHELIRELAIYENSPKAHTATVEEYIRDYNLGMFEAHVAEDISQTTEGGKIVGLIFYYMAYSTWRGRMLYLEDFVVTDTYRRYGVGQMLFDTFLEVARQKDCFLVKWQVLDWNLPAIKFYEKNNALIEKEWWNGKIFLKPIE